MNQKAITTLEFNKIIDMLKSKAISKMGKQMCFELLPSCDREEIEAWQKETTEAVSMILKKGSLPLGGIHDVEESIKRTAIGGVLSIEELLHVGEFLYVCKKTVNYSKAENKNDVFPILFPYFSAIQTVPQLEREINRCIINSTEIADDASQALLTIRRNIKIQNDKIREQLNSVIHSQTYKTMLQDSVITMRNGRFCVPIKQEYKNSFNGMIHDQSSTGATVFIEPISVVQLNNKIRELDADEKKEIEKILIKLSSMVAESSELLLLNSQTLTYIDFVFAKGELSLAMNGSQPVFNDNGYINIRKGRHPLLNKTTVVPTDIYIGKDFTTLLITGPNTGGKTVSLKTVGLFTLMGQAGLHIAANDNSELSVFDNIFADIGDEQSIEQSLSTFSSHMCNIVKILDEVTCNSLVLLDELGAGTDPTEGAALAIAILQFLHGLKVRTIVTTHYSELKVYALSTKGLENACCEFDVQTLRPTYKLLIGVPGKSNAFAISQKLGLPDYIISAAKETLSNENVRLEDVITDLEISRKQLSIEKERAEAFRQEAEKLHKEAEIQKQKLNSQREKLLQKAKEEARELMQKAKEEADVLFKDFQKQLKENSSQKSISEARQKISEKLSQLEKSTEHKVNYKPITKKLSKGDKVFVRTLNQSGIITSIDSDKEVTVLAGIMKIKVKIKDLSHDESEQTIKFNNKAVSHSVKLQKSLTVSPELDLRGYLVSEGIEKTDKYLDDAYLSGISQVTIIHGKGTGVLRAAIHEHLKRHTHVKSYRLGKFGEGDAGVTVVEFN